MSTPNQLRHIAFIMDGNRRWADTKGFPRVRGHKEGIFAIERVVQGCIDNGIPYLTVFAFSTENWKRTHVELRYLSRLMFRYLSLLIRGKIGSGVLEQARIDFIGDRGMFGQRNSALMAEVEDATVSNTGCRVIVAVNYGGRDEIVHAANRAIAKGAVSLEISDIDENLYLPGAPFPDLIVRTGNEIRISNFLIWQSAYAELLFVEKMWPDIQQSDVARYKHAYLSRHRSFGA